MKNRNIALCIVLSIVTCGIYSIYWWIVATDEMHQVAPNEYQTSGGIAFLLSLITCNIYGFYWAYRMGEKVDQAKGNPGGSHGVLFLVLQFLGLNIVNLCLMQDEINRHCA